MKRRTRIFLLLLLILPPLLLLGGGAYLLSDRGVNEEVRPRLEKFLTQRLGAEVRLGRLHLGTERLVVDELFLHKEGRWRIAADRMEAEFTLADLFDRRLRLLRLHAPDVEFTGGGEGEIPESPPLTIDRFELLDGRGTFRAAGREWHLQELAADGALAGTTSFRLAARLGKDEGAAVEFRGRFVWGKPPALIFQSARWEGRELLTAPLTASLLPGGGAVGGGIALDRFDERQLARIFHVLEVKNPLPENARFSLRDLEIRFTQEGESLALDLNAAEGVVAAGEREIPFRRLQVRGGREGETLHGEGQLLLAGKAPLHVRGKYAQGKASATIELSASDPGQLLRDLAGVEPPPFEGGLELQAEANVAAGRLAVTARLRGTPGKTRGGGLPDISLLSGELRGRSEGEKFSGDLRLRLGGREFLVARGTPGRIVAELRSTDGRELAPLLPAKVRSPLLGSAEGIAVSVEAVRASKGWSGKADLRAKRATLEKGVLEEVRLATLFSTGAGRLALHQGSFATVFSGEGLPSLRLSAAGEGAVEGRRFRATFSRMSADDIEFLTEDGTAGFSGGRLQGRGTVSGEPGGPITLDLTVSVRASEALKGAFYANLKPLPAELVVRGTFDPGRRLFNAQRLHLSLEGVGVTDVRGSVAPGQIELTGGIEVPDLRSALGRLRAVAGDALPVLKELEAAGDLRSDLTLARSAAGWRLRGAALPRGLDLQWPGKKLHLVGVSGSVPFDLGPAVPSGAGERSGEISFATLRFGPAHASGKTIRLRSAPNRISLGTLDLRVAGGDIVIADPSADFTAETSFDATLAIRGADLGELSRELGLPEMAGTLTADLGRIRYRGGTLTTAGEMVIDVFGGRIRVRNLRLESLATKYPTYSADAEFTGIDLQQLTHTLAFGEINGIADGYVRQLRLFGKVPSRFEALLETRPTGRRNISVKALRNLTTISQGGIGAVLSRGVYRFIDFYRYRKIGFYCTLKNDVFILKGTARDQSGRYLVDGGLLPPKINIIAPEHAISFKEMIKRLQRMERTETKMAPSTEN